MMLYWERGLVLEDEDSGYETGTGGSSN
jgi:hypothetical protein